MPPSASAGLRKARSGAETATVRAIMDYLRYRGYLALRMNSRVVMLPGRAGRPTPYRMGGVKGVADILVCAPRQHLAMGGIHASDPPVCGRFCAIEVKSETGKPTPEQTAFLAAVVRAGGIAFIARSVKDVQEHGL